jgi:hypothetical protein
MKAKLIIKLHRLLIGLALFTALYQAAAQGTAFTYQGRLNNNGSAANGSYDLQFVLFNTNQFGSPATPILTNSAVPVNNGLFTTTLDFGASVFTGTNYWLDISVRTNGSVTFAELSPRQPVTPTPYAITAENLSGVVENNFINEGVSLATIGGGSGNSISIGADYSTIGGGLNNEDLTTLTTIGGGGENVARADAATVGGGQENTASGTNATVSGGGFNVASGQNATVSGGKSNMGSGPYTTIGGGLQNTTTGDGATVCGGKFNAALGASSFAAGFSAEALHDGTFVWADSQNASFSSTASNQFLIRAGGGVGINMNNPNGASLYVQGNRTGVAPNAFQNPIAVFENTSTAMGSSPALRVIVDGGDSPSGALTVSANGTGNIAQFGNHTAFVVTIANNGTLTCQSLVQTSDRNVKENFATLDSKTVLAKVISLPMTEWNYKSDSKDVQHIGPMAQDFHAAFDLNGADDKHISVVDEGGVALAAIQGLNQKVEEQNSQLKKKDIEIQELNQRLEALEKIVLSQKSK